jgi:hypothetical protein
MPRRNIFVFRIEKFNSKNFVVVKLQKCIRTHINFQTLLITLNFSLTNVLQNSLPRNDILDLLPGPFICVTVGDQPVTCVRH